MGTQCPLTVTLAALFLFTLKDLSEAVSGAPEHDALPCPAAILIIMVSCCQFAASSEPHCAGTV